MAIILHIGFPKTATTSLQLGLKAHAADLERAGLLYPLVDTDFKQRYLKYLVTRSGNSSCVSTELMHLHNCILNSVDKNILLSCEELTNIFMTDFRDTSLVRLRDFLRALTSDIRLIAYVRNPAEFYISMMQEKLKRSGGIVAPDRFLARFAYIIAQYEKVFQSKVIVRNFSRSDLVGQDIITDFFSQFSDLFQVDVAAWDRLAANEALTPETMFVLDRARGAGSERSRQAPQDMETERFWRRIKRIARSLGNAGRPILFRAAAEAVLHANADDRRALTERYGVNFGEYAFLDRRPHYSLSEQISEVENIVEVDRTVALAIWNAYLGQQRARPIGVRHQ